MPMPGRSVPWALAMLAAAAGALGAIGSDGLWLIPLGHLVAHGRLPGSIPFATAPAHWHDVPAGAELVFWTLYRTLGGLRGLVLAQSVAAAAAFGILASGLRRQGGDGPALVVAIVVFVGAIPAVVVVGVFLPARSWLSSPIRSCGIHRCTTKLSSTRLSPAKERACGRRSR